MLPFESQAPFPIDWSSAPAASRALRQLALRGLDLALGDAGAERPAQLDAITSWAVPARPPAHLRHARRSLEGAFLIETPDIDDALGARLAAEAIPPRRCDRIAGAALRLVTPKEGPRTRFGQEALRALAAQAFGDPDFRREAGRRMRGVLRRRVLFHPGPTPTPRLSDACLLTLALCARPRTQESGRAAREMRQAWNGLEEAASQLRAQSGWAGFWDQWILREARRRLTLPRDLADMTLLAQSSRLEGESGPAAEPDAAASTDMVDSAPATALAEDPRLSEGWLAQAPAWWPQLLSDLP